MTKDFPEKESNIPRNPYEILLRNHNSNILKVSNQLQDYQNYIIHFKNDNFDKTSLRLKHKYEHVCMGVSGGSCELNSRRVAILRGDPRITIEPDLKVTACVGIPGVNYVGVNYVGVNATRKTNSPGKVVYPSQVNPWEIARIGADKSSTKAGDKTGTVNGVDVYVVDTGIQTNHPDLNVVGGKNFTSSSPSYNDDNGHGTHVAGTIGAKDNTTFVVGIAPGVNLWAIKVLDKNGSGSFSSVIAGIDYVTGIKKSNPSKPIVINMSLGAYVGTSSYNSLDNAIKAAINAGIVVCVAAGNEYRNSSLYSPAHVTEAITVGAYNINNKFASFSNWGPVVDILAPGVNILSTVPTNSTATYSGTSMATPTVAGTIALLLSTNKTLTPVQVKDYLITAAKNPKFYSKLPNSPTPTNPTISNVPAGTTNLSVFCGNF